MTSRGLRNCFVGVPLLAKSRAMTECAAHSAGIACVISIRVNPSSSNAFLRVARET